ncbi:MAG: MlaA family lipoprotein [Cetobacterium sp.]
MVSYKKILLCLSCTFIVGCTSIESNFSEKVSQEKQTHKINEKIELNKKSFLALSNGKEMSYSPETSNNETLEYKDIDGTKFIEVYDPLEPMNRRIYYFNYYLDKYVLIPTVNTYDYLTPKIVQRRVSKFFSNLQEINTFLNSILQLEGKKATITLVRFGINSTVGVLGLFDVATSLDLPKNYEDFGLTLAKYGIGNGPYLVLPGFGPSNLRDTTGKAVGVMTLSEINPYDSPIGLDIRHPGVSTLNLIDIRKTNKNFRYYGTGSPFEYEYVRYFYTKYREALIEVK